MYNRDNKQKCPICELNFDKNIYGKHLIFCRDRHERKTKTESLRTYEIYNDNCNVNDVEMITGRVSSNSSSDNNNNSNQIDSNNGNNANQNYRKSKENKKDSEEKELNKKKIKNNYENYKENLRKEKTKKKNSKIRKNNFTDFDDFENESSDEVVLNKMERNTGINTGWREIREFMITFIFAALIFTFFSFVK